MIPEAVRRFLREKGSGEIISVQAVGGGCINNGSKLKSSSGATYFLKTNTHVPIEMFARETEGLEELRIGGGPRVPQPYLYSSDFLLLEDLDPQPRRVDYWETFGRQMAALHQKEGPSYGFAHDNFIGSTPQPNPWTQDAFAFFSEQRLLYQARLAQRRGLLGLVEIKQVERLITRLPDLIPEQPASLIHGDLWAGNAITDREGNPAIIDPAAHYGWAEADLAMTTLFGTFPDSFYLAYQEVRPLVSGYWKRFPIYNLYHLLNHLNLFGSGYYEQVTTILNQY